MEVVLLLPEADLARSSSRTRKFSSSSKTTIAASMKYNKTTAPQNAKKSLREAAAGLIYGSSFAVGGL